MSTLTLTPVIKSIQSSSSSSFSEMRAGHGLTVNSSKQTGQRHPFTDYWEGNELFADFDLSSLPALATITDAALKPTGTATIGDEATDAYNAYLYDFGDSVTTADWRTTEPGGPLGSVVNPSANGMPTQFQDDDDLLTAAQNAGTGHLRIVIAAQNQLKAGTAPPLGDDATLLFGGLQLVLTYSLPVPTVSSVSPQTLQAADGGDITITGTGFKNEGAGTTTVVVGGVNATSVHVVSDTEITCTVAGATAGQKQVTVTNSNGSSSQFVFLYLVTVNDNSVKLVKAGSVVGDDKADTDTDWPLDGTAKIYGGPTDLWGTTWTPAQVNATDFGVALSATIEPHSRAYVGYADVTVYFTVPGASDPASYLVALQVGEDKQTATLAVYKLPRSGFTVGQDSSIDRATSDAEFYTSRMFSPSRNVSKTYRAVELWADISPTTNVPGLQVWASVGGGTFFQLLDKDKSDGTSGDALTVKTSGMHRFYFPKTSDAVGDDVQLKYVIPALGTGEVPVDVAIRDVSIRASLRPVRTEIVTTRIVLGAGEFQDKGSMRYTVDKQVALLEDLLKPGKVTAFRDPVSGEEGYMELVAMTRTDVSDPIRSERTELADIVIRRTFYGD